jgi:hypothetical protein
MITSYSLGSPPTPPSTRLLASSGALETHLTLYKVGDRQHLSRMHVRLFACSPVRLFAWGVCSNGLRLECQAGLPEAHAALEASGQGDLLAEAYRLQGEFLLRQALPDAARAEACFQQALTVARRQQAKSWELRVALSLSRLWQRQGKRTEARALLAPIYGWFTEGFDTADLQEAQALLTALA